MDPYSQEELAEARKTIKKLRTKNGAIEPEAAEYLRENFPESLEAINNNRRTVGRLTQMLSRNLYSKNTRFIFELIQNADDNHYSSAGRAHELPRISLTLNPEGFVLDCNEDGFTEKHVAAVCSVAQSTKAGEKARGYIGEKGIGFKSVFRVFKRARIQSGPFAFSFSYDPNNGEDAGLDLVTPILEDHADLPATVKTRISLSLPYGSNFEDMRRDLAEVPDTMLLFLNRIRQLEIHINAPDHTTSSVVYTRRQKSSDAAVIEQQTTAGKSTKTLTRKYLLERINAVDLPAHETREGIHTAEVLLAFPVQIDNVPILELQHAYAFLPLQKPGFKFLIQSDFITNASREMLDDGCARNKALLTQAAKAFRNAAERFASDQYPEALQYAWPGFLPDDDTAKDPFWRQLRTEVLNLLQQSEVIKAWNGQLCLPKGIYHLPRHMLDGSKNPLLPDLQSPTYLSPKYGSSKILRLKSLGVVDFTPELFLARLRSELQNSSCKMRVLSFEHNWRDSLACCIDDIWANHPDLRPDIRKLPLVHLQNGKLASVDQTRCYWPKIRGTNVPQQLDISLVSQEAIGCSLPYAKLLRLLGVTECSVDLVVSKIVDVYKEKRYSGVTRAGLVHHQHFIFMFASERNDVVIPVEAHYNGNRILARTDLASRGHHIYFGEKSDELSPGVLLSSSTPVYKEARIYFLATDFLQLISGTNVNQYGYTWKSWLETKCGVRSTVQLLTPSGSILSMEFRYLLENEQGSALRLLQAQWPSYQTRSASLRTLLSEVELQTEAGSRAPLKDLYARHSENINDIESVGAEGSLFLEPPPGFDRFDQSWRFLTNLGVKFEVDLKFYLCALEAMYLKDESAVNFDHVLQIYRVLSGRAGSDPKAKTEIKQLERLFECFYKPADIGDGTNAEWLGVEQCCWTGKSLLTVVFRLSAIPQYKSDKAIETLFKDIWGVSNATFLTYIDELLRMKLGGVHDPDKVAKLYKELFALSTPTNKSEIREKLRFEELFYHHTQRVWISPEWCSWVESKIRLDGHHGVSDLYQDVAGLKSFFCDIVGIKEPSVRMYVQTLQRAATENRPFVELKQHMHQISVLGPEKSDLETIKTAPIFRVRSATGTESMVSMEREFFVVDREEYSVLFGNKVTTLCMSLKEIQHCRNFLLALGLEQRFCSRAATRCTHVTDSRPSPEFTAKFRGLTEHMLRCASFYNESSEEAELQNLVTKLQSVHAFVSDSITRYVEIKQGGQAFKSDDIQAAFHFTDDDGGLKLYVPQDDESRECCLHHDLPLGFMSIMNIVNEQAVAPIQSILTSNYPRAITEKLAGAGVPPLSDSLKLLIEPVTQVVNVPISSIEVGSEPEVDLSEGLSALRISPRDSRSLSRERSETPPTPTSVVSLTTNFARGSSSHSGGPVPIFAARTPSPSRRDEFSHILERVIKTAEGTPTAATPTSLPFSQLFARGDFQRDFHVGVAGEVYLLNYLQHHRITGFGIDHWRSSIRTLAEAHEKYRNIGRSTGPEDADFVYKDVSGALTTFLKDEGAIPVNANLADAVEYYLEVKTTTNGCNEKFYMSQNQVDRMENMSMLPNVRASRLYVIARVFNIDGPNVEVKFYVDPHRMRDIIRPFHHEVGIEDDVLKFSAEKWVIQAEG